MKHPKSAIIVLIITIFSITFCNAQESNYVSSGEYIDGYVILSSSDTLHGYLKELDIFDSCKKVVFKNQKNEKVKINAKKILSYNRGGEIFVRKDYQLGKFQGKMIGLLKLIEDGRVKLYQHSYSYSTSSTSFNNFNSKSNTDFYIERYGKLMMVNKLHFKNEMSMYFSDNEEIVKKIVNEEYKFKDIIEIVKLYNSAG